MPLTRIKNKGLGNSVSFENINDTGTEGTKVASGTTAQRGTTQGQWRFNTTTGFFEGRNASTFSTLEPTPVVTSVDVTEVDTNAGGSTTFVVTGTDFTSGGVIAFIANDSSEFNADTTTFNSSTQVTAVKTNSSFLNAKEPYKVKFTSATGKAGISGSGLINVDSAPTWNTAAGSLGSIYHDINANHFTLSATDAEGDAIIYSETGGTNISNAGLSLSNGGVISGNPNDVGSDTTISFTGRATANSKTTDRAFSFIVKPALGSSTNAATGPKQLYDAGYTTDGVYYINNIFTGGSARQCYCRFNTRDGVHWQRFTPYHLSGYHKSLHGGGAGNTSLTFTTSDSQLQNTTLSTSVKDFVYSGQNSGAGVSYMIRTGKQMPDIEGHYLGIELFTTSTGDGGNRPRIGLDWQSSEGTGNWGHDYSQESNWLQGGRDATFQANTRNFAAVKFAADGANTTITSKNSTVGGMYGVDDTTSNLWSRYQNNSENGYYPTNSGEGQNSYTVDDAYWWAIRIGGWSDNSNPLTFYGIFYMGEK